MRKIKGIIFALAAGFLCYAFSFAAECASVEDKASEAGGLVQEFIRTAIAEFKSMETSQLDYSEVGSRIQEYAQGFADTLLASGVKMETAAAIMHKASVFYGQSMESLLNGNDYDFVMQEYSANISELFGQLPLNAQDRLKIVAMGNDSLEAVNSFFQDYRDEVIYN